MPNFSYLSKYWNIYTYPWRPNSDFLEQIDNYILTENLNILILWSTKEFRNKYKNHNITVCDMSLDMIKWNDVWNENENILLSNWLELDNTKYDIILWDLIFFLLNNDEKKIFFKKIKNKLSNNWKFIFRTAFNTKINDIDLFLNNINKINNDLIKFNYITFELVIWNNFIWKDISKFLLEHNIKFTDFSKIYQKFTPYNTSKINIENKCKFDILLRDFNIENVISKKFVFCEECIYVISNKNA